MGQGEEATPTNKTSMERHKVEKFFESDSNQRYNIVSSSEKNLNFSKSFEQHFKATGQLVSCEQLLLSFTLVFLFQHQQLQCDRARQILCFYTPFFHLFFKSRSRSLLIPFPKAPVSVWQRGFSSLAKCLNIHCCDLNLGAVCQKPFEKSVFSISGKRLSKAHHWQGDFVIPFMGLSWDQALCNKL